MKNLHLDRRSRYSMQVIRSALFDLLNEKELNRITVTDICSLAAVNRGTFYKYYKDVPDLFSKIEDSVVEDICRIIQEDCLSTVSIEQIISNILDILIQNQDFSRLIAKNPTGTRFLRKIVQPFRPRFIESLLQNIPQLNEKYADYSFEFILGGVVSFIMQWVITDMAVPKEQVEILLVHFIYAAFREENFRDLRP